MMVQVDEGLWNSLLELDALMQEKKSLANQLEDFTLNEYDNPVTLLIYQPSVLFYCSIRSFEKNMLCYIALIIF